MPIYLYNKVVWLISEVRTSLITCTGQISVTRSRVRYADVSWKEGKTPIVFFVIQISVSLSIVRYLCSLVDPRTLSFQMFLPVIHVNFTFLGYRVI